MMTAQTVKPSSARWGLNRPEVEAGRITVERIDVAARWLGDDRTRYRVLLDGDDIGSVESFRDESYRKAGRLRIVTGQPLRWRYESPVETFSRGVYDTRLQAIEALLESWER